MVPLTFIGAVSELSMGLYQALFDGGRNTALPKYGNYLLRLCEASVRANIAAQCSPRASHVVHLLRL